MNGNDLWNFNGLNSTGGKTPRIINPLWPFDQVSALPANQIARVAVRWTNSVPTWAKRLDNHNVPSQTPCSTEKQNLTDLKAFWEPKFPVFIVFITLTPGQEFFFSNFKNKHIIVFVFQHTYTIHQRFIKKTKGMCKSKEKQINIKTLNACN